MNERLTDEEIIALRKTAFGGRFGVPELRPWSDTLKFARAVESAVLARAAVPAVQPQEPVAWRRWEGDCMWVYYETKAWDDLQPLYAAPQARQEQPDSVHLTEPKGEAATARDAARYEQDLWLRELFRLIEAWRVLRDGIPVKAEAWSALWKHAHNIGPHWRARAFAALSSTPAHDPLRQAAEQFLASCQDGNVPELVDYYEEIFREALSSTPGDGGTGGELASAQSVFDELMAFEEASEVRPTFADAVRIALAAKKRASGVAPVEAPSSREVMQMALDALETALAGLEWYRDRCPGDVNGSDDEADEKIGAAMGALVGALGVEVRYVRKPEADRRISRGDDFAGDAWLDTHTGETVYTVVGFDRNQQPTMVVQDGRAVSTAGVPGRVGPEGWKRLDESQQALAQADQRISEIGEKYGLDDAGVQPSQAQSSKSPDMMDPPWEEIVAAHEKHTQGCVMHGLPHPCEACSAELAVQLERDEFREALKQIADMDPASQRADDLGRAARIARTALANHSGVAPSHEPEPRMAFCPACFVEVTPEQAGEQINAARVLAEFAKTAPGRPPSRVQEALAVIDGVALPRAPKENDRA